MKLPSSLGVAAIAGLALLPSAGHAQAARTSTCGVETWSTEKMTYVSTPCTEGPEVGAPAATPALSTDAAYCAALVKSYDQYLNRDSRLGAQPLSLDTRLGAEKCRTGDPGGIAPLEKALRDARIGLPKRS